MAEQKHMQLLAPNNHIKNTSTCGVLLTKSKLKLAEKLLFSQGCREKHTVRFEGRRRGQVRVHVSRRLAQRENIFPRLTVSPRQQNVGASLTAPSSKSPIEKKSLNPISFSLYYCFSCYHILSPDQPYPRTDTLWQGILYQLHDHFASLGHSSLANSSFAKPVG